MPPNALMVRLATAPVPGVSITTVPPPPPPPAASVAATGFLSYERMPWALMVLAELTTSAPARISTMPPPGAPDEVSEPEPPLAVATSVGGKAVMASAVPLLEPPAPPPPPRKNLGRDIGRQAGATTPAGIKAPRPELAAEVGLLSATVVLLPPFHELPPMPPAPALPPPPPPES